MCEQHNNESVRAKGGGLVFYKGLGKSMVRSSEAAVGLV